MRNYMNPFSFSLSRMEDSQHSPTQKSALTTPILGSFNSSRKREKTFELNMVRKLQELRALQHQHPEPLNKGKLMLCDEILNMIAVNEGKYAEAMRLVYKELRAALLNDNVFYHQELKKLDPSRMLLPSSRLVTSL